MGGAVRVTKPMTVEEFLAWDSGDDLVYELIDGFPRLKDPPNPNLMGQAAPTDDHNAIVANLMIALAAVVRSKGLPCRVLPGSGQRIQRRRNRMRIPDLMVKCGSSPRDATEPLLVAEVLSPSNTAIDLAERDMDYRSLPGLREILLIEQDRPAVTIARRVGDLWRTDRVEGLDAVLTLETVEADLPLSELYRDVLAGPTDP